MRLPLTAFEAFAEDSRNPTREGTDREDRAQAWLTIASAAETLSALRGRKRSEFLREFDDSLLPPAGTRPSIVHDVAPAPEAGLGLVTERFRVAAEEMERGGFLNLAYTTVSALCRVVVREDQPTRLMTTIHLGRIARQLSDIPVAIDCYRSVALSGIRERDGPSAARGFIGLGMVALMKGNLPLVRKMFERALLHAPPAQNVVGLAHMGLSNVARRQQQYADALSHGWLAYDNVASQHDRNNILSNLATIALQTGHARAALKGFIVALSPSSDAPERAVGGYDDAMLAAARVGESEWLLEFEAKGFEAVRRLQQPFEIARFSLASANAWHEMGLSERSLFRLETVLSIAESHGYHELLARAKSLVASIESEERGPSKSPETTWSESPEFLQSIERFGLLSA